MAIVTRGKKFQALQRRLRRQNAAFKKLSLAKQRIKIAEDVIDQLRLKQLRAESTYLRVNALAYTPRTEITDVDAAEALCQTKCDVCGIGSLFVTAVKRADELPLHDLMSRNTRSLAVEYLGKWFDSAALDLVEGYFERWNGIHYDSPIFLMDSQNKRLKMIMENIISNNGRFNPLKGAHKAPRGSKPGGYKPEVYNEP